MTLTDFLLARIADDEAAARAQEGSGYERRWSFARVLAECEAKRRIVGLHVEASPGSCVTCGGEHHPCPTLRALAAIYANHVDHRDDWRP